MTRRDEILVELHDIDRRIGQLQTERMAKQAEYDQTPATQLGQSEATSKYEADLKAYADNAERSGRLKPLQPGEIVRPSSTFGI